MDEKATLGEYLDRFRSALLSRWDGLGEYHARRPLTTSGTNVAGLVKHAALIQFGYLGEVFDRPADRPMPWFDDDAEPNADLWVPPGESLSFVRELHAASAEHADRTIAALPLDARGRVPWWSEARADVTLHQILVHLVTEYARHAGHADILRESLDGERGTGPDDPNLPFHGDREWAAYRERVERDARAAAGTSAPTTLAP